MKPHTRLLLRITYCLILIGMSQLPLHAQMTDQVLLTDYQINPESKGNLSLELDNTLFFKNNEFDGHFIKGYSLPGLWIQPKLVYNPLSNLKLEVGAHALIYRGAYRSPTYAYNDVSFWSGKQS